MENGENNVLHEGEESSGERNGSGTVRRLLKIVAARRDIKDAQFRNAEDF